MTELTTKNYSLDDGTLELQADKMVIDDKAKRRNLLQKIAMGCGIIYSGSVVGTGWNEGNEAYMFFGIALLVTWLVLLVLSFFHPRITAREILYADIDRVVCKTIWGSTTKRVSILLKNKKIRTLLLSNKSDQLTEFLEELEKRGGEMDEK